MKERIRIGRYDDPESVGYQAWIETDKWVIWIGNDGNLTIGTDRSENGAVGKFIEVEVE